MRTNKRLALQISLSVAIAIVVAYFLDIQNPYWTLLAILVLICPRYEQTLHKSFLRILSTILGATLGGIVIWLADFPTTYLLLAGIGGYFTIYYGRISYFKTIFFASVMVVAIAGILHPWSWAIVLSRILQTGLGAIIALIVSMIISPSKNYAEYSEKIKEILTQELLFYKQGSNIFFSYELYWKTLKKIRSNLSELKRNEMEMRFKDLLHFKRNKRIYTSKILYKNLMLLADIFFVLNKLKIENKDYKPYLNLFRHLVLADFIKINSTLNLNIQFKIPSDPIHFEDTDVEYLSIVKFSESLLSNLQETYSIIPKSKDES